MTHFTPPAGENILLAQFIPSPNIFHISTIRVTIALAGDWLLIVLSFIAAIFFPYPMMYGAAAIVIARSQLALAVMMHEGAHGLLARKQRTNDVIGQLFAAGPLWLSLCTYRAGHLQHHHSPMHSDDPVALIFDLQNFPLSPGKLLARLLLYASGIGYLLSIVRLARGKFSNALPRADKSTPYIAWEISSMLISNAILFSTLTLVGHSILYLGLWLIPSITLLPLAGQIRAIFEHAGLSACSDQSQNARTIVRRSWQTFLLGPHSIHFHIEHHLFTRVPFYNLKTIHKQLAKLQLLPKNNLYTGYGKVLHDITRQQNRNQPQ